MIGDSLRLSIGTLSVVRVPPPRQVDRRIAGRAMILAPLAVVPIGAVAAAVGGGAALWLHPGVAAALVVAIAALSTRAMHLDGLADTADGLTASYDAARSLEVMKSGVSGPAGVAAIVVVLVLQILAIGTLLDSGWRGACVVGVLLCVSRLAAPSVAMRGVRPARASGLGATFAQSVPRSTTAVLWLTGIGALIASALVLDLPWWQGAVAGLAALSVVAAVIARSVRRLGGVTGDTFGATIEVAFVALLVVFSAR